MLLDEVEPPFDFATSITLGAYCSLVCVEDSCPLASQKEL